ncbi:MAG: radical SAM protein [Desulfobacterales bacterium]|nr:radical SAM protein [Desulfobacterales bacterium]
MNLNKLTPANRKFRGPGFWETFKETFLGVRRPLDCLQVEVTSRCPGRCTYCPRTVLQENWLGRDMAGDTFVRLWPLMRRAGRVHLQGWGEPLLNPFFFEMVALARKAGCSVSTTTGGLLMTPDLALRIVDSGIDIVAFSLAGTDSTGNAPRHGMDFGQVCAAISTLQMVREKRQGVHLEIHIAYLLLASNLDNVRGLPDLMKRLGVHAVVISTLDFLPDPQLTGEAFSLQDPHKLARAAVVLEETAIRARELDLGFHFELPDPDAPGNNCRENIQRSLFVSADGAVSPCVYVNVPMSCQDPNRRVFGNVREQDPMEIWDSEAFRSFRDSLAQGNPNTPCRSCPKRMMK